MAEYQIGDLVVLKSGSMRMCVEDVSDAGIATVWCNEGAIGRDLFDPRLLNKWEHREDHGSRGGERRGGDRDGPRGAGGGKPWGGDRDGGHRGSGKPYGKGGDRDRDGDDRPPRKTGWDGKPRDKKYFRKDD